MGCATGKPKDCSFDSFDCTEKGAEKFAAKNTHTAGVAYEGIDREKTIPKILLPLRRHGCVVWLYTPALILLQMLIPPLQPNCANGWSNIAACGMLVVVFHHIYSEREAWEAAKSLSTPPEVIVLRQIGVLRRRARLFFLGIVEDLDIYTDMLFPCLVFSCDQFNDTSETMTGMWIESWQDMGSIGRSMGGVAKLVRLWGWALLFVLLNWVLEVISLARMMTYKVPPSSEVDKEIGRVSGEDFFALAEHAETAVMPSVALYSEEMAAQKKWVFQHKDTREKAKAQENFVFGKHFDYSKVEQMEITHQEEVQRTAAAARGFHLAQLAIRILIGHVMQMWIQASFLIYGFEQSGAQARYKVMASMVLSFIMVVARTYRAQSAIQQLGLIGIAFVLVTAFFTVWSGAKVFFAYKCKDHVWNLSTGCVKLENVETIAGPPSRPTASTTLLTTTITLLSDSVAS